MEKSLLFLLYILQHPVTREDFCGKPSTPYNNSIISLGTSLVTSIIGAHEHQGHFPPARIPMTDFQNWSKIFNFLHLPTRGLDRSICNQAWLDMCQSTSCSTLIKTKSDHYPLLLHFETADSTFASSFKFLKMWSLHDNCKDAIASCWKTTITGCPMFILTKKLLLLKQRLEIWNKETFGNVHELVTTAIRILEERNFICLKDYVIRLIQQSQDKKSLLTHVHCRHRREE
ncbi:hypothetical protein MTR_7g058360 [Medicago truncatula]|uniref:Endonuclease/exonuclease/phosphatase n=1 Tax=Medicago truncatula TaxID=3880 RepID=G7L183_MEDTR|nr:hypothetical protein MTR_7g058360 [Medicago truncatula]